MNPPLVTVYQPPGDSGIRAVLVLHVVPHSRRLLVALRCVRKLSLRGAPAFPPELESLIQLDRVATRDNPGQFHTTWRDPEPTSFAHKRVEIIHAASTRDVLGSTHYGGTALGVFDVADRALRSEVTTWMDSLPNVVVHTRVHQLETRYFLVLADLFSETANSSLGRAVSDTLRQHH